MRARLALTPLLLLLRLAAPEAARAHPPELVGRAPAGPSSLRLLFAPPLPRQVTRVRGTVRPFVNLLGPGGGAITNLAVERTFAAPLRLGLELAPVALALEPGRTGAITHLRVSAAYATDYVELGAAVGSRLQRFGPGGLSLAGTLRLGALDGLRLELAYGYALARNYYTGRRLLAFSHTTADLQVPLMRGLAAVVEGGFSFDVWLYATAGLRHTLRGRGGPGTWILHGAFGLAWVLDRFPCRFEDPTPCVGAAWALGPTLVVGVERRF